MNRMTQSRSKIGCLLALMLPIGLAACGAQADAALSDTTLPTFSKDRVAQEAPVEVRRMLTGGDELGGFYYMAPSPDGLYVTSILWPDVSVLELATGAQRRITGALDWRKGAYPDGAIFSSDGSRIAYVWQAAPDETNPTWSWQLRSIGIDGTDMNVHLSFDDNRVYENPEDWSKDGRYILTTLFEERNELGVKQDEDVQIVTLDVATNEIRVLKTLDSPGGARGAFFSPDGRFVAFDFRSSPDSQERDISLVSSDGSQETMLIQTPDYEEMLGWLPDGSGVLFYRKAEDSWAIWKLPLRDGQPSGQPELVKDDVLDMTGLGFSDDAYFYGVTVSRPGVHMASFDLETGRVLEPLAPVAVLPGLGSDNATWSPDGTRFVYFSTEEGSNDERPSRIIVRSVTGEILQDLPLVLKRPAHAGWTAHGLVVWERGQDTPAGFYLISLETGEATYLRKPPSSDRIPPFTVSEDGSSFFIGDPGGPITEYDLATGREHVLVEQDGYALAGFPDSPEARILAGTVSPDGDNILYQVALDGPDAPARNGGMALEIYSLSTGESRAIGGFARLIGSTWSPDGRYVVLDGQLELTGGHQLLRISVEDGSVISLAEGPERFHRPKVSPDGRHVLVTTGESRQEIWRMTFNSGG